ncbi:MAG: transporter substrate-binding domain-containing protein [Paludibacteraceae bacterium]|nr:transporter substrate-binding domain-containing protein [Paludibacteraceae bacterium]
MSRRKHYFIVGGCAIIVMIVLSFVLFSQDYLEKHKPYDLEYIQDQNKLRVIVEPNAMSYKVIDVDSIAGLQVLMIDSFSKAMNIKNVEYITETNLAKAIELLLNHDVDILAWHIPIYNTKRDEINYSIPVFTSRQMLIQRKQNPKDSVEFIRNQLGLADKEVYLQAGTFYRQRIENLSKEIGDSIHIKEVANAKPIDLFNMLVNRDIDYTVCDEFVARVLIKENKEFSKLDMNTAISFTQNYSWCVHPDCPLLLDSLNSWLAKYLESKEYNKIYRKYTGVK